MLMNLNNFWKEDFSKKDGILSQFKCVFFLRGYPESIQSPQKIWVDSPKIRMESPMILKTFWGSTQYPLRRWYWILFLGSIGHPYKILHTSLKYNRIFERKTFYTQKRYRKITSVQSLQVFYPQIENFNFFFASSNLRVVRLWIAYEKVKN